MKFNYGNKASLEALINILKSKLADVALTGDWSDLSTIPTPQDIGAAPSTVLNGKNTNDITEPGFYTMIQGRNGPKTFRYFGLLVLKSDTGPQYTEQIAFIEKTDEVYIRYGYQYSSANKTVSWSAWTQLATLDSLDSIVNAYVKKITTISDGETSSVKYDDGYGYSAIILEKSGYPFPVLRLEVVTDYDDAYIDESTYSIEMGNGRFYPSKQDMTLGVSYGKWEAVYAKNGVIQTSDRDEKNSIEKLSVEKSKALILGLIPSTYKMNAGTSGRTHWGMISQDVEALLEELGWTSLDFAGFIKSPRYKLYDIEEEVEAEDGKKTTVKKQKRQLVEGEFDYSLRYDEFIPPVIVIVKDHEQRLNTLEQKVESQANEIIDLKSKVEILEQMVQQLLQEREQ